MDSTVIKHFLWSAIVLIGSVNSLPTTMERMTMSRMRLADLETSATGYTYDQQPGKQASYVQYTNHGTGGYYDAPKPIQYINYGHPQRILHSSPTIVPASLPAYKTGIPAIPPGYIVPLLPVSKNPPLAPYYVPAEAHKTFERSHGADDDSEEDDSIEEHDDDEEHSEGEDFNAENHSSSGEHSDEGYSNHHEFKSGEQGNHHKDGLEGHYNEEGGNKKSHSESAGHYGDYDEADKVNEGSNYGEESYHKKGGKTTGFHNVYRKDEYKKDTDFYDEDHKSGHYDKHSSSGKHHSSADGGFEKGQQYDSGYENREKGEDGYYDKGHENAHHQGSRSKEGGDSFYNNHSDYAATNEAKEHKNYGHYNRR